MYVRICSVVFNFDESSSTVLFPEWAPAQGSLLVGRRRLFHRVMSQEGRRILFLA